MRGKGIAMRVAPRPILAGHRQLELDLLVVGSDVLVAQGPVGAHPVEGAGREIAGVEPRGVAGVVHHGAAHPAPGVVLAQLNWVVTADDALLGPVQRVGAGLVGHPVLVGVPERAGLEDHDPPARTRQPLRQHRATGAGPDDHQVDLVVVAVAAHGLFAGQVARVHVEQEPRLVVLRADGPLEQAPPEVAHHNSPFCTTCTGSSSVAPGISYGSRAASGPVAPPRRMNPRG